MHVVIFAGGKGTRLGGGVPKPLVRLDRRPLVEHVMQIYASQGHTYFDLLAGYRSWQMEEWVRESGLVGRWSLGVLDTGEETQTGGRLLRWLRSGDGSPDRFLLTYADGLADVNLAALLDHHSRTHAAVTLTAVNPTNRFGKVEVEAGMVTAFSEKLADRCGWVNGGFYVVEPEVLDLIPGDACVWERDILPVLAAQGRLAAFQHPGEFLCVDTPRDLAVARALSRRSTTPPFWLRWST